jgi:rhamnosyltransferase
VTNDNLTAKNFAVSKADGAKAIILTSMQQAQLLSRPRVAVLMAAYNGMKWIEEQVRSILEQEGVDVHLFVSVDPSSDGTYDWCSRLSVQDQRVTVLPSGEKFGGAARNFFRLIRDVDFSSYEYVSLADQDDIWNKEKLKLASDQLASGKFAGYSSNVIAFWSDGRQLLINKAQRQRKYDFLFEAAGPGCTYVLIGTEALKFKKFLSVNWSAVNEVALHDWLIYAWFRVNSLGWYIDTVPRVFYRQHSSNQVGANQGIKAIFNRIKMLRSGWYRTEIGKIASLVGDEHSLRPEMIRKDGAVSLLFLFRNVFEVRRRLRDQLFFFVVVVLGLY